VAYLSNQTRVSSLLIGGVDYTSSMVEWTVSDQSAFKNGAIQTSGTLYLGSRPGGFDIADYERDDFRRGTVVTLDVTDPGGVAYRHPRGYLYIVSTAYDIEKEQLEVQLGCRLVLMALNEDVDDLLAIVPVGLDVAQRTYQNCSASFAAVGKYVYQDNTGALVSGVFFDGDGYDGVASGEWLSVLGLTTTAVSPLQGAEPIPDTVSLSYQVPADGLNEDGKGKIDTVETESYYFTKYPAVRFKRNGYSIVSLPGGVVEITYKKPVFVRTGRFTPSDSGSSGCGNSPPPPSSQEDGYWILACTQDWETVQEPLYLPTYSRETIKTYYSGPAGQVSRNLQELRGPAIEANGQYWADKYAYCRSLNAVQCLPDGDCPIEGMDERLLSYTDTVNYYGTANELIRTVVDNYLTVMSAAQPENWRSGNNNGFPQNFDQDFANNTDMYRSRRTDTTYYQEGSVNVEKVVTYESLATARGAGINGIMDALRGVMTIQIRKSSTNTTVTEAPDRLNSPTTATKGRRIFVNLFIGRYKDLPPEAGPYVLEEQIPVPLLFNNEADITSAVNVYRDYIERFIKGDALGVQLSESLRTDITTNWKPGMPFRYYDSSKGKLMAMRMDATVWGVNAEESALTTNGVWIGDSDGSVVLPENLLGNSKPDMGSGVTPPPAVVNPSVQGETNVDSGSFVWNVDVHFGTKALPQAFGSDGVIPIIPDSYTESPQLMTGIYISGAVVGPGDLLETENDGSVPLDAQGSLVTVDSTIIVEDLFS